MMIDFAAYRIDLSRFLNISISRDSGISLKYDTCDYCWFFCSEEDLDYWQSRLNLTSDLLQKKNDTDFSVYIIFL